MRIVAEDTKLARVGFDWDKVKLPKMLPVRPISRGYLQYRNNPDA